MKSLECNKMIVTAGVLLLVAAAVWATTPDSSVTSKLMTSEDEIKLKRVQAQARYDNVAKDFDKALKVWSDRMAATLGRLEKLEIEVEPDGAGSDTPAQGAGGASVPATQPAEKRADRALAPTTQPAEKHEPESPASLSSIFSRIPKDVAVVHPAPPPAPTSIASSLREIAGQVAVLTRAPASARATLHTAGGTTGRPGFTERCERIARELEALASDIRSIPRRAAIAHPGRVGASELSRREQ